MTVGTHSSLKAIRKNIPILDALSSVEFKALAGHLIEKRVQKGNCIIRSSDESATLFFLVSGRLRVSVSSREGKELSIAILKEGDFVGEMALLTGSRRTADVAALTDCILLSLSRHDFLNHIRTHQGLLIHMLKAMAERLYSTSVKLADFALMDVQCRLIKALFTISSPGTVEDREVHVVDERMTHREIASLIGTSREVVSRILRSLAESGAVEIKSGKIILYDS